MDKKTKLIIGGSVGGAALVALVVVSIVLANRPSALIVRAIANTISDAKRIELYDVADDMVNGGSVSVSANLDKIANDDVFVEAKLYTDAKNMKGAYEMTVKEDDNVVLNSHILYNQDRFTFCCAELFDGTYGVTYKNLEKTLPGSIFDPDEETDYSLDDDQYVYFLNLKDTVKNDKNLQRDLSNMSAKYRKVAVNALVKHAEITKASKTITVGGEKIPCNIITLTLDEEALALAAKDVVDYANNDKDLEKLLYRVASNGSYSEDPEEYVDQFYDSLEEFVEEIEDSDQEIELNIDFYITRSGRRLARLDAEMEVGDEGAEISLVLGKNVAKSKEISFKASEKGSKNAYEITYTVEENSSKAYEAEIEFKETRDYHGEAEVEKKTVKVEWDRKAGDFELKMKDDYDDLLIKGNLIQKGDKYIFLLTNVRSDGKPIPIVKSLDLTITVDRHDPAPNAPGRYTEVTTMSERDFKHLYNDISDGLEELWDEYFDR